MTLSEPAQLQICFETAKGEYVCSDQFVLCSSEFFSVTFDSETSPIELKMISVIGGNAFHLTKNTGDYVAGKYFYTTNFELDDFLLAKKEQCPFTLCTLTTNSDMVTITQDGWKPEAFVIETSEEDNVAAILKCTFFADWSVQTILRFVVNTDCQPDSTTVQMTAEKFTLFLDEPQPIFEL